METIKLVNGEELKLKRDFLTAGQISNLVKEALVIYSEGGLLDNYSFNPVDMEINFYAGLFYFVIEDYDMNDGDKFEELFSLGVHKELLEKIQNAQIAYDLMWKSANEISNSLGILMNKLANIADVFASMDLDEIKEKLPDDINNWQNIVTEYKEITRDNNKGDKTE